MEYHNCNGGRVSIIEPAFLSEMINTYRKEKCNRKESLKSNSSHNTHSHSTFFLCNVTFPTDTMLM